MKTKKNIWLWALYDLANSIIMIVFFLYFAQWIVVDAGISDFYFNLTFTISALLLLITVPFTSSLLDKHWRRIVGIRWTTTLTFICYATCSLLAVNNIAVPSLIFYTAGLYFYLFSFTYYTPLLTDIAPKNKLGYVSGIGIAANYVGQFAGLLLVLPFANGIFSFFGANPRAETLLPAVILFFVLALPMMLFFDEPKKKKIDVSFTERIKTTWKDTRALFLIGNVLFFMIAYFFFNDGILTAANNFSIFLEQVWHVSDNIKTAILVGILITSGIGGYLSGLIADKIGHKKTLMWLLGGWLFILPVIALATNFALLVISAVSMGLWYGASWSVSRSLMSEVAPKGKHNLAFGYFGLAERASSFLGPIVWGVIVSGMVYVGSFRYRLATLAVTLFVILGIIALSFVKEKTRKQQTVNR